MSRQSNEDKEERRPVGKSASQSLDLRCEGVSSKGVASKI